MSSDKADSNLGSLVRQHLIDCGVETPMIENGLSNQDKLDIIQSNFKTIMETLGLDLTDDSLIETPRRVAKMYVNEIFYGLDYSKFPKCTTIENKMGYDEMVAVNDISVQSNCEHHLVVFEGYAAVAYIPKDKVLGLSKLNRLVKFFAKRPQVQERLTEQVFHALRYILETDDIAVHINAQHFCVKSRGIEDANSRTITSKLGGVFKGHNTRMEFLAFVR